MWGMLHGELMAFINEMEDKRQFSNLTMFLFIRPPLQKNGFKITTVFSSDLQQIENPWGILARNVYDQEKPRMEDIVEVKK